MCQNFPPSLRLRTSQCMYRPHFVYLFMSRWTLGYFPCLAFMNNAALNKGVQAPVQIPTFTPLGYIPRSGVAASYGNSIIIFLNNL